MEAGNESPPLRSTILGSFLRGRPRNSSQSQPPPEAIRELSPSPPQPPSPGGLASQLNRRSRISAAPAVQTSSSHQNSTSNTGLGLTNMLRRRRSAGQMAASPAAQTNGPTLPAPILAAHSVSAGNTPVQPPTVAPTPPLNINGGTSSPNASKVHRIRLVPHIEGRRSLRFDAIPRDLKEGDPPIRIGRFTDRSGVGLAAINAMNSNKLAFRSKVVSRAHAELWVEPGPKFFIKDTKSSSGTFLNHTRLSPANTESRPFQMKDGDILQLGVDYQGGAEDIYKSVKIRVEIGREWQAGPNAFNTNAMKNLKALIPGKPAAKITAAVAQGVVAKTQIPDCCICLFGVTIRQALFVAPCSHAFHYKCIRPMLETHHPAFNCPLCRTYADLEEDVEVDASEGAEGEFEEDGASSDGLDPNMSGARTAHPGAQGGTASSLPPLPLLSAPREDRDRGAETEVENDAGRPVLRITTAQARTPELLDERGELDIDGDGDEIMMDLAAAPPAASDSDAEVQGVLDGHGHGHGHGPGSIRPPPLEMERGGSGSARTRDGLGDVIVPVAVVGELGEMDVEGGEVDGTVGGKRKR